MTHPPIDVGALNLREAVRALLLDDDGHVLLVRYEFPTATVWGLPGGGLEPGEDDIAGLRRELEEELGLTDVVIGPQIWRREHVIPCSPATTDSATACTSCGCRGSTPCR